MGLTSAAAKALAATMLVAGFSDAGRDEWTRAAHMRPVEKKPQRRTPDETERRRRRKAARTARKRNR